MNYRLIPVIIWLILVGIIFAVWKSSDGRKIVPPTEIIYTPIPVTQEQITVSGEIVCLPHKDQSGPQTLECAYGLKADDGKYYGLSDLNFEHLPGLPTGERVTIEGKFRTSVDSKYADEGTIEISEVERL